MKLYTKLFESFLGQSRVWYSLERIIFLFSSISFSLSDLIDQMKLYSLGSNFGISAVKSLSLTFS